MLDKFRQLKAENDRLRAEIDGFKSRLTNAADDYVRGAMLGLGWQGGCARMQGNPTG